MNSSFHIRKAATADFNDLNELLGSLGYETNESQREERRRIFEAILGNGYQEVLVAEKGSQRKVQALISYSLLPQMRLSGFKVEIDELVVSPECRGTGLGSELVRHVIAASREKGVKSVIISSNRDRESYQRSFYKKLGFSEKNSAFFEFKP